MALRTVFIVNPASGGGRTARLWERWSAILEDAGVTAESRITSRAGDATRLARAALEDGAMRVVAVGGDGTLNEVLNGYLDPATRAPVREGAVLGLFPSGTGGDFRRTMHIPVDPRGCAELLARGSVRHIDAGRVEYDPRSGIAPRHFLNIADCGVGGEVVARVNRSRTVLGGTTTFLYHSLATLLTYEARAVRVEADGELLVGRAENVVIANGRYFGGGMHVAPEALPEDGLLDLVLIGERSRPRTFAEIHRVYAGSHMRLRGIEHRRARSVRVTPLGDEPVLFDVDGEQIGAAPATVTCIPGAVRFAAP